MAKAQKPWTTEPFTAKKQPCPPTPKKDGSNDAVALVEKMRKETPDL